MKPIIALSALLLVAVTALAQDPEELLRDAAFVGRFTSLEASLEMEITDRATRSRTLELFFEDNDGDYRALLQVIAPPFLNQMKFLTQRSGDRTDQWMATSRGARRIAGGGGDERLFDSDFTVDDFSPVPSGEYTATREPDRDVAGEACFVVRVTPHDASLDYAHRILFISQEDRLLVRAEYVAEDGSLLRLFELQDRMRVDGRPFPRRAVMSTLTEGTHTVLHVRDVQEDVAIPARIFSRGNL